ncbi:MAG: FdhF/YdeP family oxidoreductase [bacterium]
MRHIPESAPVPSAGGGMKKVLYTLRTAQRAGLRATSKALNSKNTCKTCGLGMGGQLGGMTNELGEFPSVCNKSVQAQSTDLQPPIPSEIFKHSLAELRELDERELARLGRLAQPIFKPAGAAHYREVSWSFALAQAVEQLRMTQRDRSFFYASGRSSNEAGFILQLLARLYGTNNVNNCSYYCHQATTEGLHTTVGTGTATVELADLQHSDCIIVLGANPASNHPRFIYQLQNCRQRGGEVIVINPAREPGLVRFAMPKSARSLIAGGTAIATQYVQPNIGGDIALLKGIAKSVIARGGAAQTFLDQHTENADAYLAEVAALSWRDIESHSGVRQADIEHIAELYCRAERVVFAWGMGLTHHLHGVANVEEVANLALLRGMVGKPHAGLLPLRGHSNVQGIGTIGVKPVLGSDVFRALEQHLDIRLPSGAGLDTMACLQAADAGGIDHAFIMGGNLFSASPNRHWTETALNRVRSKTFLTTTLNRSHIYGSDHGASLVLPVLARDEEKQATTQESMFNYVRLSDGGIDRISGPRSETDIIVSIASAVVAPTVFDFRCFQTHQSIRHAIAATVPGMAPLASIDVARAEFHIHGRLLKTPQFARSGGRARFAVNPLPPHNSARGFRLATVRSEGQFNTLIYENEDSYRGTKSRWCIFMNRADMQALGLDRHALVDVTSSSGAMTGLLAVPFDLPAGNTLAYFPEANVLISTDIDQRSRTPAFKNVAVDIRPHVGTGTPLKPNK